jgi:hypothetical protein
MKPVNAIRILLIVLTALAAMPSDAKSFYRYKNKQGQVVIKDQLTNEMIAAGYDEISENGNLIRRVPPGKTLAELEQEKLKKIEEQKRKLELQRQIRRDAELLRQFSSVSDIIRTRDAQLLGLEQRIKIQGSKSDLLKLQLEDQQRQAATYERLGQKIPKVLQDDIAHTMKLIEDNEHNAKILEEEKKKVAARYEKDILRFRDLQAKRRALKQVEEEEKAKEPVVYNCPTVKACDQAWQVAQVFARDNATGQIEIITNTLILTSKPEKNHDIGISFSRLPNGNNKYQIVLEISCSDSEKGVEFCKTETVRDLRKQFLEEVKKRAS